SFSQIALNTLRPTRVRARVGSSLSGSALSAIRSVPPGLTARLSPDAVVDGVPDLIELHPAAATVTATRTVAERSSAGMAHLPIRYVDRILYTKPRSTGAA